jgi:hypothetical protein
LVAADIANLYPSIDIVDCLIQLEQFLFPYRSDISLDVDLIMSLVKFILYNNYFEIEGLFFHQVSGVAMGTPCAVMVSVIYVHMLETATKLAIDPTRRPLYLVRYIDDFFGIFLTVADAQDFFACFNTQRDTIKVPLQELQFSYSEYNVGVNFLDFTIFGCSYDPCLLSIKLFSKPFHQSHHLYIHFHSGHALHIKKGFIKSELNRIFLRCSTRSDCLLAFDNFYSSLVKRGYPIPFLDICFLHVGRLTLSEEEYQGKHINYISHRLIVKYSRPGTSTPLVYKRKAGGDWPTNEILATECINWAPSFMSIFNGRPPIIVTYGYTGIGAFLNKRRKLYS